MLIQIVAGEARGSLVERMFREQGDAVERLLPVGDDVVAEGFNGLTRKRVVHAFDLLQADDVGLTFL